MCTAIATRGKNFYFGRTLDYHKSYDESVVITPRNFAFDFLPNGVRGGHYAIIGAAVKNKLPLYYDAMNECGLCIAGLNFPETARYFPAECGKINLAQYQFIPYMLSLCRSVEECEELLAKINITDESYSPQLPAAPLHWILADGVRTVVAESTAEGIIVHADPAGVLTNEPRFEFQLLNLNNYMHLSPRQPQNVFSGSLDLKPTGMGFGAIGLPGDMSPQSRFVRAAFFAANCRADSVADFFNIMSAMGVPRGSCYSAEEEATIYTSCCSPSEGAYYYKTEGGLSVCRVSLRGVDLSSSQLFSFAMGEN